MPGDCTRYFFDSHSFSEFPNPVLVLILSSLSVIFGKIQKIKYKLSINFVDKGNRGDRLKTSFPSPLYRQKQEGLYMV